jgi:hypothetical protein
VLSPHEGRTRVHVQHYTKVPKVTLLQTRFFIHESKIDSEFKQHKILLAPFFDTSRPAQKEAAGARLSKNTYRLAKAIA